jgi:hypothetical protein
MNNPPFQKMTLVSLDALSQLDKLEKRLENEDHKKKISEQELNSLDQDMKNILERHDLDDHSKIDLYFHTLQKYNNINKNKESELNKTIQVEVMNPTPIPIQNDTELKVMASVPKEHKDKASYIMSKIKADPELGWDEKSQLKVNDIVIPGTNMIDIVNYMMNKSKSVKEPLGWDYLSSSLSRLNLPQQLFGKQDILTKRQTNNGQTTTRQSRRKQKKKKLDDQFIWEQW